MERARRNVEGGQRRPLPVVISRLPNSDVAGGCVQVRSKCAAAWGCSALPCWACRKPLGWPAWGSQDATLARHSLPQLPTLPLLPCIHSVPPWPESLQGDVALLSAYAAEVLLPHVRVGMPEDLAAEPALGAAAGAPATAAKRGSPSAPVGGAGEPGTAGAGAAGAGEGGRKSAGRPKERPDDLLPALMRYLQAAPRTAKAKARAGLGAALACARKSLHAACRRAAGLPHTQRRPSLHHPVHSHPSHLACPCPAQIAEEFPAAHPGRRVPKKWVQDAVKEHADWQGGAKGWVLKPSGLALAAGGAVAAAAGAAAAAPAPTPGAAAAGEAAAAAGEAVGGASAAPVEPTPAATKPTAGAGIERYLCKKVWGWALVG